MMLSTHLIYPDADLEHANNLLSGLFNCWFGIGQALGPLFGSVIYQTIGFRALCDITAGISVAVSILYFIFGEGCQAISQTCKNFSERKVKRTLSQEEVLTEEISKIRQSSHLRCPIVPPNFKRTLSSMSLLGNQ